MPNQQGNPPYDNRGPGQGGNYGAPQNYPPQQNYGPPGQGPMPMNNFGRRDTYQGERRDPVPPYQGNYNQGQQGNYYPPGQRDSSPGPQRNYAPYQRDLRGDNRNYNPQNNANYGQGAEGSYGQGMGSVPSGYGESQRFSQVDQIDSPPPPMGNTNRVRHSFLF